MCAPASIILLEYDQKKYKYIRNRKTSVGHQERYRIALCATDDG